MSAGLGPGSMLKIHDHDTVTFFCILALVSVITVLAIAALSWMLEVFCGLFLLKRGLQGALFFCSQLILYCYTT